MPTQDEKVPAGSHAMLFWNTLAFTWCFACWMLNGVLVTFLTENQIFDWTTIEIGWLLGIPVLTGALFRLPAGILTDRFGGKWVYGLLLLGTAVPMYLLSYADSYLDFALCSFGFGLTGTSFSIGIAYTSVWYPQKWQGTALGIFGAGNAGAAITTLAAPSLLKSLTDNGANLDGWRTLPILYALVLVGMGVLFLIFTTNRKPARRSNDLKTLLAPLSNIRVWRFGLYYFLVFGCFVALSQWLVPYFVNMYSVTLVTAGFFAAMFSLPSGIIRALGGWMTDKWGARIVMYWVLGLSVATTAFLVVPKMEIYSPGAGIMALKSGTVTAVSDSKITVDKFEYALRSKSSVNLTTPTEKDQFKVLPDREYWHEAQVAVGEKIKKKQLLAKGITRIYFQANLYIALCIICIVGIVWGIGKAAVYKHIPEYFPDQVGVVGGMVGVLGGLGGFFCPIIFGYLLDYTGLWTSMWIFLVFLSTICLLWMHKTIRKMSVIPKTFEPRDMHYFIWDAKKYDVGVDEMNRQHEGLVMKMNELIAGANAVSDKKDMMKLISELEVRMKNHFSDEEDYMKSIAYPKLKEHQRDHTALLVKFAHLRDEYHRGSGVISETFIEFLKLWLSSHFLVRDDYGRTRREP